MTGGVGAAMLTAEVPMKMLMAVIVAVALAGCATPVGKTPCGGVWGKPCGCPAKSCSEPCSSCCDVIPCPVEGCAP